MPQQRSLPRAAVCRNEHDLHSGETGESAMDTQRLGRHTYAAVTANTSERFASVKIFRHALIATLNAAMVQSLAFIVSKCNKTRIDAIGSIDAMIELIQSVTCSTVESKYTFRPRWRFPFVRRPSPHLNRCTARSDTNRENLSTSFRGCTPMRSGAWPLGSLSVPHVRASAPSKYSGPISSLCMKCCMSSKSNPSGARSWCRSESWIRALSSYRSQYMLSAARHNLL
jgi:hypothetical protein